MLAGASMFPTRLPSQNGRVFTSLSRLSALWTNLIASVFSVEPEATFLATGKKGVANGLLDFSWKFARWPRRLHDKLPNERLPRPGCCRVEHK